MSANANVRPPTPGKALTTWQRAGGKAVALNRMGVHLGNPKEMISKADAYAVELKPGTMLGGTVTVLALIAAAVYAAMQIDQSLHTPPTIQAITEWADTQGPFPMRVRCLAASGCYVSNRHNDQWSSHGDEVQQKGCLVLAQGESYVLNITFTQNPLNGLAVVWDASLPPAEGDPPGAGLAVGADTNCPPPACASGIHNLLTPVLGGSYLANYVQTENFTSPVAPLRREWFITYVSRDKSVNPLATACSDVLTPQQVATYTQATIKIMSAWYRVTVSIDNVWLNVWGVCGGALQLCLQIGACMLIIFELAKHFLPLWKQRVVTFVSSSGAGAGAGSATSPGAASHHGAAPTPSGPSFLAAVSALSTPRGAGPHHKSPAGGFNRPSPLVTREAIDRLVLYSVSGSGATSPPGPTPKKKVQLAASAVAASAPAATGGARSDRQAPPAPGVAMLQGCPAGAWGAEEGEAELLSLSGGEVGDGAAHVRVGVVRSGGSNTGPVGSNGAK